MMVQLSTQTQQLGTTLFACAVLHTFLVKKLQGLALKYREGSVLENLFHLLGEIEVVFGVWAGLFLLILAFIEGRHTSVQYLNSMNFIEPLFVFIVLVVCSTKPVLSIANIGINFIVKILPFNKTVCFYLTTLVIGPLLGSVITEPAAMTVTALLLFNRLYSLKISEKLAYSTLGLLFVNVSIGGTLTPFAAPPILMVSRVWGWDLNFMLINFGTKAILSSILSTIFVIFLNKKELLSLKLFIEDNSKTTPIWISGLHLLFLLTTALFAHQPLLLIFTFLFFLGAVTVTKEYQYELKLKEGLLVGFFLAGLIIFGPMQRWWLEPLLSTMNHFTLYLGATCLTAITDNAALTYLGSQVPNLSDEAKLLLVKGSVVGGGLTVIANAPNPAGFNILNSKFGRAGISPLKLFLNALLPTLVAFFIFWGI